MFYRSHHYFLHSNSAVSPVIGIMLMISVTLILAAIIGGMTGGLTQIQKKPPSIIMEASMMNNSTCYTSLDMTVISVSEGIPTKNLKFITEWNNGTIVRTVTDSTSKKTENAPIQRYPMGISFNSSKTNVSDFGDYTLMPGTRMFANTTNDALNKLFGSSSGLPKQGDVIRLQIVYIPSGSTIVEKEITVRE